MVRLYFDKFVLRAATEGRKSRRIKIDNFDFGAKCSEIAARLDGLSGREISKLGAAWQVCALAILTHLHFVRDSVCCVLFLAPCMTLQDK